MCTKAEQEPWLHELRKEIKVTMFLFIYYSKHCIDNPPINRDE
jgi:hypothetical protein